MVETRSARKAKRGASPSGARSKSPGGARSTATKAKSPKAPENGAAAAPPAELSPFDMTPGQKLVQCYFLPMLLLVPAPTLCAVLAFATNGGATAPTAGGIRDYALAHGVGGLLRASFAFVGVGSSAAWTFLLVGDESPVPEFGDRVRRGAGGVGLSLFTAHLAAAYGHRNHRYFDPNIFFDDDDIIPGRPRRLDLVVST